MSERVVVTRPSGTQVTLAVIVAPGEAQCSACAVKLQRSTDGTLTDGVRAHYKTVHPERGIK